MQFVLRAALNLDRVLADWKLEADGARTDEVVEPEGEPVGALRLARGVFEVNACRDRLAVRLVEDRDLKPAQPVLRRGGDPDPQPRGEERCRRRDDASHDSQAYPWARRG